MDNSNFPAESLVPSPGVADFEERVEHHNAENEGVRIYYAGRGTPDRHAPRLPGLLVHLALPEVAVLYESCRVAALIRTVTTSAANPKV